MENRKRDLQHAEKSGYNFEHNYGHGEQHLSVVFAMLMMLAFLVDQAQQLCCALFQAVWTQLGSKRLLWERMRALFYMYALTSMRQLFEALLYGLKKPTPVLGLDSTSSPAMLLVTAYHSTPRRLASSGGKVCLDLPRSPFFARHPRMADRKSLFKRQHWRGETLCTLSTAMGLIGLLD